MLASPRYPERFESADGVVSYAFPTDDYEYQPEQGFRRSEAAAVGADYAVDFAGGAPWPKAVAEEAVRFTIWGASAADADAQFEDCVAGLRSIGLGRLFAVDAAGDRRWCWAKLLARPSYQVDVNAYFKVPVMLRFARYSDWFAATPETGSVVIASTRHRFTITSPGHGSRSVRRVSLPLQHPKRLHEPFARQPHQRLQRRLQPRSRDRRL